MQPDRVDKNADRGNKQNQDTHRVPAAEVAIAYLRAISTPITRRILKLHKTDF